MSLRARLLIVFAVLIATYVATAYVVVSSQRSLLVDQVDQQLRALPPNLSFSLQGPPPESGQASEQAGEGPPPVVTNVLTEFYVGLIGSDGFEKPLATGVQQAAPPDIAAAVSATGGAPGIVTVRSTDGSTTYRAIVQPQLRMDATGQPISDVTEWVVAAQSLEEAQATIARLVRTLWAAGAILAVVLGVVFFWVERLGLRPIARVTAAAEAITAGNRSHRVEVRDRRTEAGKLGRAFNLMLDERDEGEARLRQFVADASHELRTPLTSIAGYLELYRQGAFQERAQLDDVVRRLSAESVRMHGLVEDLLALASLDEGRPLRHEDIDLGQVLRDAAQDAQAVQPERSIAVDAPEAGPSVVGDPSLVVQLVGILISNALAHTPTSAPITLTTRQEPSGALISIADKGPGLEPDVAARVFDRFWRGQAGRKRAKRTGQGAGTGLGLSIARSITDAHGGSIALDTAPSQGCTFTIRLPLQPDRSG